MAGSVAKGVFCLGHFEPKLILHPNASTVYPQTIHFTTLITFIIAFYSAGMDKAVNLTYLTQLLFFHFIFPIDFKA